MNKPVCEAFRHSKAFIPFITAGDPDLETTARLVLAMQDAGADLIELGIPFSDPTAEGPTILQANSRALANGITTDDVLAMVSQLKDQIHIPLVFMTYANVIYSYGTERFMQTAAQAGISGLILPDVPFEEKAEFEIPARQAGLDLISMIAPTSASRIAQIASEAKGFLYCVSSLGVTGARNEIKSDIEGMIAQVREVSDIPCAIGFGIANESQAAKIAAKSDGAIVGSAIVSLCARHGKDAPDAVAAFVRSMKQAVVAAS